MIRFGSRFSVPGAQFSAIGYRLSAIGSWFSVLGSQFLVPGSWFLVLSSRFLVIGSPMSISCIIIAGGASRRMGTDKRRLRLWGERSPTLLEYMVTRAARFSDDIVVALNDPEAWNGLPARLVRDEVEQSGPLAGLAAGLAVCRHEYALALACDLPLVQDALIDALLAYPRPYDALAPIRPDGGARAPRNPQAAEPLLAIYRRTCLAAIRDCLQRGARAG